MTKAPVRKPPARKTVQVHSEPELEAVQAPPAAKQGLLATLFAGLDEAHVEASERVQRLEGELEEATRELRAVEALKRIREGGELPLLGGTSAARATRKAPGGGEGSGGRQPRGDVPKQVLELLSEHPNGLPAGTIIDRLQADDKMKTSIRNFLASGKRNGTLRYDEVAKTYAKA